MAKFHEHVKRSLVKAITFRAVVLTSDSILVFFITHRYDVTIAVVMLSNFASTILYFIHERVWNRIHWGKSTKK